jgi:hypothetical protein
MLGIILLINSRIPPLPSFFPEVLILIRAILNSLGRSLLFLFFRLLVCYYNAYVFCVISHFGFQERSKRAPVRIKDGLVLLLISDFRFLSLAFLSLA